MRIASNGLHMSSPKLDSATEGPHFETCPEQKQLLSRIQQHACELRRVDMARSAAEAAKAETSGEG